MNQNIKTIDLKKITNKIKLIVPDCLAKDYQAYEGWQRLADSNVKKGCKVELIKHMITSHWEYDMTSVYLCPSACVANSGLHVCEVTTQSSNTCSELKLQSNTSTKENT